MLSTGGVIAALVLVVITAAPAVSGDIRRASLQNQEQQATVSGQVSAAGTLRPLAGAQVSIPGTGIGGLTDASGRYRLEGVPAGDAALRVQMIGYGQAERTVSVPPGQTYTWARTTVRSPSTMDRS